MIVSGFLSPGEKELLRCLKAEPRARFVKTLPYALPPRYDPSAEDSREIAAEFTELKALGNLAPGDFRTVRQESFYLGETVSNADLIASLGEECRHKKGGERQASIGFAAT